MKQSITILVFVILLAKTVNAQNYVVSGYVYDSETKECLIGARLYEKETRKGIVSNNFGFYSISLPQKDSIHLSVNYFGYKKLDTTLVLSNDLKINFLLKKGIDLQEVKVVEERNTEISTIKIPIKEMEILPSLTGEKDIIRAYQLMPGIQSGSEGTSNLYVRGGSPDQNLILIDDVPVYYINHLGGFVSIFDENAINSMKLIKGGFPARYGGRLSSVVDIRLKNGNMNKPHGEISVGIIASRFFLESPIIKNKTSFFVSVRRCNLDYFTRPFFKYLQSGGVNSGYTFYDFNFKIQHKFNERNRLYYSIYSGRDKIFVNMTDINEKLFPEIEPYNQYKMELNNSWGNLLNSLRWNYTYNNKLFSNLTFAYSIFGYNYHTNYQNIEVATENIQSSFLQQYKTSIQDFILKLDYDYFLNSNNHLKFGGYYTYRKFNPGANVYSLHIDSLADLDTTWNEPKLFSHEYALYLEDNIEIRKNVTLNLGVHASGYNIRNKFFYSIQPRVVADIKLFKDFHLNASYTTMQQYIHLHSNTQSVIPTDLWLPATELALPEKATQYSAGLTNSLLNKKIYVSIEGFYKNLQNLIEQKQFVDYNSIGTSWEEQIVTDGKGKVYGVEFLLQKTKGNLTGWIAYTYSKNVRQFDSINSGFEFPFNYDRRHDLSIVANYRIDNKITFSATWVYGTGLPTTVGISKYNIINYFENNTNTVQSNYRSYNYNYNQAYMYGAKNNYRMPDYHRLDIAINFTKQKKRGVRTWSISIYNLYNRQNPYFLYFGKDENNQQQLYQFSLFPIIPSVSYSFKF